MLIRTQSGTLKPKHILDLPFSPKPILRQHVIDNAWGHHASCTAKIGADSDPMAVLDSSFRVAEASKLCEVWTLASKTDPSEPNRRKEFLTGYGWSYLECFPSICPDQAGITHSDCSTIPATTYQPGFRRKPLGLSAWV